MWWRCVHSEAYPAVALWIAAATTWLECKLHTQKDSIMQLHKHTNAQQLGQCRVHLLHPVIACDRMLFEGSCSRPVLFLVSPYLFICGASHQAMSCAASHYAFAWICLRTHVCLSALGNAWARASLEPHSRAVARSQKKGVCVQDMCLTSAANDARTECSV